MGVKRESIGCAYTSLLAAVNIRSRPSKILGLGGVFGRGTFRVIEHQVLVIGSRSHPFSVVCQGRF